MADPWPTPRPDALVRLEHDVELGRCDLNLLLFEVAIGEVQSSYRLGRGSTAAACLPLGHTQGQALQTFERLIVARIREMGQAMIHDFFAHRAAVYTPPAT